MAELFAQAQDGADKNYYSIYSDLNGMRWIKFWGYFSCDAISHKRPWRLMEYFAADFPYSDFLLMSRDELSSNLTEIKQIIGNFTEAEALEGMNHFYETYCLPPDERTVQKLALSHLTENTPSGLYVEEEEILGIEG